MSGLFIRRLLDVYWSRKVGIWYVTIWRLGVAVKAPWAASYFWDGPGVIWRGYKWRIGFRRYLP